MKAICLGGAGRIARESLFDLVEFSDFEKITVADYDEAEGCRVAQWLNDPRVDCVRVDVKNHDATANVLKDYDVALDGTTIALNGDSTACIARAGIHGINLNGFGAENEYDNQFQEHGKTCVPGFGMTPGTTNMMAMFAANQLDSVDTIRVSHGAFRPVAFSVAIAETTRYEYDPNLPGRIVFEDGEYKQVPPFARPRDIALPEPYGTHPEYIIPHAETLTLSKALKDKGIRLIEVRGTWPPKNMQLVRTLYDWGFMRNDKVKVGHNEAGILDLIAQYLINSTEGTETELYGYALHVEVIGQKNGKTYQYILTHTHPASDGSEPGWEKLRSYTRNVGIPMSIGAILLAQGKVEKTGVITPEEAFDPKTIFSELQKRRLIIHEQKTELTKQ